MRQRVVRGPLNRIGSFALAAAEGLCANGRSVASPSRRTGAAAPFSTTIVSCLADRDRDDVREGVRGRYDLAVRPLASRAVAKHLSLFSLPAAIAASSYYMHHQSSRTFSSIGTDTGTRSSTSAASPPVGSIGTNFSSKAPSDDKGGDGHDGEEGRRKTRMQRSATVAKRGAVSARDLFKKYGWTFVGTYFAIYWTTVAAIFAGIDSGLIDPATVMGYVKDWGMSAVPGDEPNAASAAADVEDTKNTVDMIATYLEKYEWTSRYAESVRENPHTANFGLAWFATKFTEPIRLGMSFVLVPRVHRALGKKDPHAHEEADHTGDGESKGGQEPK
eukprot:CAMPEP_0197443204 /NCGR_PEP_ID=MMETSP1175-20131217/9006_1 /TAXON_ID=1003142 /ORGANISM="Triceratium dubium, Strain CCMP147" /LENGTH=331 /DNA_ID=CAMNT_0042973801 /DNA_START=152 /DNA_END=1147 /DNA_ORIENTATION=-